MNDAHLDLYWVDAHEQFTSDLDRGLLRLGHFLARRLRRRPPIGKAYAPAAPKAVESDAPMSATARAALAGLMACVATIALLATVASLATSGAARGADLHTAMPAGSPVIPHMILA